jgi:hypothetical protein
MQHGAIIEMTHCAQLLRSPAFAHLGIQAQLMQLAAYRTLTALQMAA